MKKNYKERYEKQSDRADGLMGLYSIHTCLLTNKINQKIQLTNELQRQCNLFLKHPQLTEVIPNVFIYWENENQYIVSLKNNLIEIFEPWFSNKQSNIDSIKKDNQNWSKLCTQIAQLYLNKGGLIQDYDENNKLPLILKKINDNPNITSEEKDQFRSVLNQLETRNETLALIYSRNTKMNEKQIAEILMHNEFSIVKQVSNDITSVMNFYSFLCEINNIKNEFSDVGDELLTLFVGDLHQYSKEIVTIITLIETLLSKVKSKEVIFNDLDNRIYFDADANLVIEDQTLRFMVRKNDTNMKIFVKEKEYKTPEQFLLEINDNNLVKINTWLFYVFYLNMNQSFGALIFPAWRN